MPPPPSSRRAILRRLAIYLIGVAIGLMLLGLMQRMRPGGSGGTGPGASSRSQQAVPDGGDSPAPDEPRPGAESADSATEPD